MTRHKDLPKSIRQGSTIEDTMVMILGANENGLDRRLGQNLQPLTKSDIC